jgi:two-component system sensor histidine kinase/response regulator
MGDLPAGSVIVVDDQPANLKVLEDILEQQGHDVRSFQHGRSALEAAIRNPPDLFLLDIDMPELNGFELCALLKLDPSLSMIPVMFLSGLSDSRDKVRAFRSGAVDYMTKPFQLDEVRVRVETHLKLHRLQRALTAQNETLEDTVDKRTKELAEANRRLDILDHSKSDFLRLISHEFRTPLHGLLGVGELIFLERPQTEQNLMLQQVFKRSSRRILSILDDALLLTQIDVDGEGLRSSPVALSVAVSDAIKKAGEFAKSRQVVLSPPPVDAGLVVGNAEMLVRALQALIETAVKFSAEGETVALSYEAVSDSRTLIIESRGRTIRDGAFHARALSGRSCYQLGIAARLQLTHYAEAPSLVKRRCPVPQLTLASLQLPRTWTLTCST